MDCNTEQDLLEKFNAHKPKFITLLGGNICRGSLNPPCCTYEFCITEDYCHSGDIVQGGFVTAMLDAAMSHAAYAIEQNIAGVSTLEISTHYLSPTRAGKIIATGIVKSGTYKIAFLEGEIRDPAGILTATSQSTVKLTRKK